MSVNSDTVVSVSTATYTALLTFTAKPQAIARTRLVVNVVMVEITPERRVAVIAHTEATNDSRIG